MVHCSYCYKDGESNIVSVSGEPGGCKNGGFPKCAQCKKRVYCSRECQRLDWKKGGHKIYCGIAGEEGVDYEIRPAIDKHHDGTNNKGLGVFALREFGKNDKIMVERAILKKPYPPQSPLLQFPSDGARKKFQSLLPVNGSFTEKANRNEISCDYDGGAGIFLTMSRVNHDCIGNSCHYYLSQRGVKLLVATRSIAPGEEITFSYCPGATTAMRSIRLLQSYRFICSCSLCGGSDDMKQKPDDTTAGSKNVVATKDSKLDTNAAEELDRMIELDEAVMNLAGSGNIGLAMRKGRQLLSLNEKYVTGSFSEYRTYYDLYQIAILKQRTFREGKQYISKAYQAILEFTSDENCEEVQKMKQYRDCPESHRNYLMLEGM